MKILHLVHNYYGFSGASRQAKNIAMGIAEYYPNVQQRFFTLESGNQKIGDISKDNFVIYSSGKHVLSRAFNLIKVIVKYRPGVAHFHGADFALLLVCKLMGVKVYWKTTLYGSDDFKELTTGRFGSIKKHLIKIIDVNNTLTKQIYITNARYLPAEKLVTIPNGVLIPDENLLPPKEDVAVIISAIIPRKAVLEGITFFNEHLRPHGFRLFVIGPSASALDGYSSAYVTECFRYADSIVNFMGELSHAETLIFLSKARFLIHLARHEGMPNVVLEAMAHCVYPIVSNMGGLADELIDDGVTGFNVDLNDEFTHLTSLPLNSQGRLKVIVNSGLVHVCQRTVEIYRALESDCLE